MADQMSRNFVRAGRVALVATALTLVPRAEAAGPYSFFSLSPCRVVDTRNAVGPQGGPSLTANSNRSFPIEGTCGVPPTAQAVVFNITMVSPTDFGDLRIYPAGTTAPLASVINWVTTDSAVANGAIVPVALGGPTVNNVTVRVDMPVGSTGTVHLVLDVTGYFQ
jgi:hypothetical protein